MPDKIHINTTAIDRTTRHTIDRAFRSLADLKHEIELAEVRLIDYAAGRAAFTHDRGLLHAQAASVNLACAFLACDMQARQVRLTTKDLEASRQDEKVRQTLAEAEATYERFDRAGRNI